MMAASRRYQCDSCKKSFYKDYVILLQLNHVICLYCNIKLEIRDEMDKEYGNKITKLECKITEMEDRIASCKCNMITSKANGKMDKENITNKPNQPAEDSTYSRNSGAGKHHCSDANDKLFPDIHLIGDSNLRDQTTEFCARRSGKRTNTFYPGAGVDDITKASLSESHSKETEEINVILAGTNDIQCETPEIVNKFSKLMKKARTNKRSIAICSILPRFDMDYNINDKIGTVNKELQVVCAKEKVPFLDVAQHFNDKSLYTSHGLHLNPVGKARLGRTLDEALLAWITSKKSVTSPKTNKNPNEKSSKSLSPKERCGNTDKNVKQQPSRQDINRKTPNSSKAREGKLTTKDSSLSRGLSPDLREMRFRL